MKIKSKHIIKKSILKIGNVSGVQGKTVNVLVDTLKNSPELFYNGSIIKNVSVGSYIEIKKGFLSLIGKIDGEKIIDKYDEYCKNKISQRELIVSLVGFINPVNGNKFEGGLKELPMIGNEVFVVTAELLEKIHDINNDILNYSITIGSTPNENIPININIDKLFCSHIAIFGNTGSGKSNTLAKIYSCLLNNEYTNNQKFRNLCKFLLYDFNGEYSSNNCICSNKNIYRLSTYNDSGLDKIKLPEETILDIDFFSILTEATDKTQRPFIKRALNFYKKIKSETDFVECIKAILRKQVTAILTMADKEKAYLLIDYMKMILPERFDLTTQQYIEINNELEWFGQHSKFRIKNTQIYFETAEDVISHNPEIYQRIDLYQSLDVFSTIVHFMYIQLIYDILDNRALNEHIAPVINRLRSKQKDIQKIIEIEDNVSIWNNSNFTIIDLKKVNIEMKKIIPLLLSKYLYEFHKRQESPSYLNIIIDEAHNILSRESFRETESWKDYRLETFEEIIKEGRKFGVFITISSQRPADISSTIVSQAHNYFIHRLINHNDLKAIETSVSYIDKITAESIPTLPVGTCIFNGISTQIPILLQVDKLSDISAPQSDTIKITKLLQ
jgi:hypothetical protein